MTESFLTRRESFNVRADHNALPKKYGQPALEKTTKFLITSSDDLRDFISAYHQFSPFGFHFIATSARLTPVLHLITCVKSSAASRCVTRYASKFNFSSTLVVSWFFIRRLGIGDSGWQDLEFLRNSRCET